jgi:thiamine kinase
MVQELARSRATDLIPEHVLAHVPGYASGELTARAARLYGGTVNTSFRVDTSAGRFVVRLHDAIARTLGANHEREAQLHAAAAAAGLAPALVHVDPELRFMVMEYVPGAVWSSQDFARPERLTRLGAALYALHAVVPPAVAPFDIPAVLASHHERLAAASPEERPWLATLMARAASALEASGTRARGKVLVHNDLHHSNLIGQERLYLLDWEYAAVADPLFDLACVLAYYPQAAPYTDTLLASSGLAPLATRDMLRQATWLFILLSYFWYRSRRLAGPPSTPADEAAERALLERLG